MEAILQQLQHAIITILIGLVTAAAAFVTSYLRAKAGEQKVRTIGIASALVEGIVEKHVEAAEQMGTPASPEGAVLLSGPQKFQKAEMGIRSELADIGKTIGKSVLTTATGVLASQIEAAVSRKFGASKAAEKTGSNS